MVQRDLVEQLRRATSSGAPSRLDRTRPLDPATLISLLAPSVIRWS